MRRFAISFQLSLSLKIFLLTRMNSPYGLSISAPTIEGIEGVPLQRVWSAVGGIEPYEFRLREGRKRTGLKIDPQTGVLSGRPLAVGTFTAYLEVKRRPNRAESMDKSQAVAARARARPYIRKEVDIRIRPRQPSSSRALATALWTHRRDSQLGADGAGRYW